MFPVSLNPYFNPTLSFSNPYFTNPEWAMRAYAQQHAWDPFSAQAYYRGGYPNSIGFDPSSFASGNIHPGSTQNQQNQLPIGFVSPAQSSSSPSPFAHGLSSPFGHLSPHEFAFGGQMNGNYLSPEFQEFIRTELLRTGKAIRTVATALENDNEQVRTQAQLALTAQFFYGLGLLYTRGVIIPRDVPGASTRADDVTPTVAGESFGEALERFAREPLQFRSNTLGELIEKARLCFRVLASEGEQLERFKEDRFKIEKKRVTA